MSVNAAFDEALTDEFRSLSYKIDAWAEKIDDWSRNIQVNNNLQETESGLRVLNKLQMDADF